MNDLENSRREINRIDIEMAHLFEARMKACEAIAAYKKERGLSIKDAARENALIERCRGEIQSPEIESYYVQFLKNTMEVSCAYQSRLISGMKVAFSGTTGAFAHIASGRMFPEAELLPYPDFGPAYRAVENGEADVAVLPIENSYAGEVGAVMDLLFSGNLYINQVQDLSISHNLIAVKGASLATVKKVISHPQALSQCSQFVTRHGLETVPYANTALAAEYVKSLNDPTVAAIASVETAETFGLEILEAGINDVQNNTTRFAALSRVPNTPLTSGVREDENFILVFTVQNRAGALAQTLNIIGAHGYNMRNLRSRPLKGLQWNYYFYIEAEGNVHNENGRDMMRELSAICARLKLVGTFSNNQRLQGGAK